MTSTTATATTPVPANQIRRGNLILASGDRGDIVEVVEVIERRRVADGSIYFLFATSDGGTLAADSTERVHRA